ncbi:MAG: hypothetical protein R6U32_02915 [Candidatus Woesearchaeota archaeon]
MAGIAFVNYLLVCIAAFSGLWAGALLAFISPEEMKAGRKYFELLVRALFVLASVPSALYFSRDGYILPSLLVALCILFMFCPWHDGKHIYRRYRFAYLLLGFFFYIPYLSSAYLSSGGSAISPALFPAAASLIFITGLPEGSLFAYEHEGMKRTRILRKIFICHSAFFINIPLYFLTTSLF